jgi:hypothetical protein
MALTLLKGSSEAQALQKENYSGFLVIGAGLPRTGTLSTRSALAQLLEGPDFSKIFFFSKISKIVFRLFFLN